jgi:hypothetical protein
MKHYRILSESLTGLGRNIFTHGQVVPASRMPGNLDELIAQNIIELVPEEAPEMIAVHEIPNAPKASKK